MHLAVALSLLVQPSLEPAHAPEVRIAYVIPADRQPQSDYLSRVRTLMGWVQGFYAFEMKRKGFGPKTFQMESGPSDAKPIVHLIRSKLTAAEFAGPGDVGYSGGPYMDHSQEALRLAGFNPNEPKTVWLTFVEAQYQAEDGSIKNETAQGDGSYGIGTALCSGLPLQVADPKMMNDHQPYDGQIVPDLGQHRLKFGVSFPDYQGKGVSSLAGVIVSATAHELGHAFLLQHTYLNDTTQNGNLMGNGFRGWRGYMFPNLFPEEGLRLSRPNALILSRSPFFQGHPVILSKTPVPKIEILNQPGKLVLTNGAFVFRFKASESKGPGIVMTTLENGTGQNGVGVVAWTEYKKPRSSVEDTITTTQIIPNREDNWRFRVFDAAGNFSEQMIKFQSPPTGIGPAPLIFFSKNSGLFNFKASCYTPQQATYHWDFGDKSTMDGELVSHRYVKSGLYEVKLVVTNRHGQSGTISQFVTESK